LYRKTCAEFSYDIIFQSEIEIWSKLCMAVKSHPNRQNAASDGEKCPIIKEITVAVQVKKFASRCRNSALTVQHWTDCEFA